MKFSLIILALLMSLLGCSKNSSNKQNIFLTLDLAAGKEKVFDRKIEETQWIGFNAKPSKAEVKKMKAKDQNCIKIIRKSDNSWVSSNYGAAITFKPEKTESIFTVQNNSSEDITVQIYWKKKD